MLRAPWPGPLGVERCSSRSSPSSRAGSAAGSVAEVFTTSRSPGRRKSPDLAEAGMHQAAVRAGCHEQPHVGAVGSADLRRLLGFERLGVARVDHRSAPMTSLAR